MGPVKTVLLFFDISSSLVFTGSTRVSLSLSLFIPHSVSLQDNEVTNS